MKRINLNPLALFRRHPPIMPGAGSELVSGSIGSYGRVWALKQIQDDNCALKQAKSEDFIKNLFVFSVSGFRGLSS
jgi:hypothetical protein